MNIARSFDINKPGTLPKKLKGGVLGGTVGIGKIKIGENQVVHYEGTNLSNKTITSSANFVAYPEKITNYLIKTECFCFQEQVLKPGESKIFTMVFYLDSSLDSDINLNDLKELVFTYEFSEYKS